VITVVYNLAVYEATIHLIKYMCKL